MPHNALHDAPLARSRAARVRTMQPNDLLIVRLPMELSDEAAAQLLDFLCQLTEALERYYAGQLLRYAQELRPESPPENPSSDPPF
jgi:hypothetical protein